MTAEVPGNVVGAQTLVKARTEGNALVSPLKNKVESLVIDCEEAYQEMDGLLAQIMNARRVWLAKIDPIIAPIRAGLDLLYSLKNDIKDPLDDYEKIAKKKMKDYKLEEARQLRLAEDNRLAKIETDRRAAEEKQRKADAAKSKPLKQKLETEAAALTTNADILDLGGAAKPVVAANSTVRAKKVAQVGNLSKLLQGIIDGVIPDDIIQINQVELNTAYRIDPETVASWPGVTIIDDINISGRRR